ncbi:hypothetical protein ACOME3_009868 [Neoechinorhynchus agilis]
MKNFGYRLGSPQPPPQSPPPPPPPPLYSRRHRHLLIHNNYIMTRPYQRRPYINPQDPLLNRYRFPNQPVFPWNHASHQFRFMMNPHALPVPQRFQRVPAQQSTAIPPFADIARLGRVTSDIDLYIANAMMYAEWETVQPYCEIAAVKCVEGRDDDAFMPYYDSKCYCDSFCFRSAQDHDCCPDYDSTCLNVQHKHPIVFAEEYQEPTIPPNHVCVASHGSLLVPLGSSIDSDCNKCTCKHFNGENILTCEEDKCANDQFLIDSINNIADTSIVKERTWTAVSYDRWNKKKLSELRTYTLGTIMRDEDKKRMEMYTLTEPDDRIYTFEPPSHWNARDAGWLIGDIRDQKSCGASWALSALDVAADRLTRDSNSHHHIDLSLQFVLSCTHRTAKEGCRAGRIDHAWGFLKDVGTLKENCYLYRSGDTKNIGSCNVAVDENDNDSLKENASLSHCPNIGESNKQLYKFSPAYKVSSEAKLIQYELYHHGPVQATMLVCPDFYQYSRGIYRRMFAGDHDLCDYHSVRIVGWGESESRLKYWLCANSWGTEWGEDGFFKIEQGDSNINDFVIATWGRSAKLTSNQ